MKAFLVTTQTETHSETTVEIVGKKLRVLQDGSGAPVVVLHHSTGNPGWIPFHEQLAAGHAVSVPDLPGFGGSERPDWARSVRDMAVLMRRGIAKLELGPVNLVGLGFGGWIAAEMASQSDHDLASLTLVGAAGIQPDEGEIADVIFYEFEEYVKLGFTSDEAYAVVFGEEAASELKELWDFSREMTAQGDLEAVDVRPAAAAPADRDERPHAAAVGRGRPGRACRRRPALRSGDAERDAAGAAGSRPPVGAGRRGGRGRRDFRLHRRRIGESSAAGAHRRGGWRYSAAGRRRARGT